MSEDNSIEPITESVDAASPSDAAATESPAEAGARWRSALFAGLIPKLSMVVAVVAILIAGALWWQYRQFYVELAESDAFLLESIEDTRAGLGPLADEVTALRGELGAGRAEVESLSGDVEVLPAQLRALERRVEALQGGQIDASDRWSREQAEYYLVLANTEVMLRGRISSALAALELADDVLRDLGDPRLGDVRRAIAAEQQALRAVPVPDLEGASAALGGLIARLPELPMRAGAPENFGSAEESLEDIEPGLGRLWASTKGAVSSIVRIERQDEPVGVVLTQTERRMIRRQLALELQLGRAAVLERRQEAFQASLVAADGILSQEFNREAPAVVEARRLLAELMGIELNPALPDISDSLALFRTTPGGA